MSSQCGDKKYEALLGAKFFTTLHADLIHDHAHAPTGKHS